MENEILSILHYFEKCCDLEIMVWDRSGGTFSRHLPWKYRMHRHALCRWAKKENGLVLCMEFEHIQFKKHAWHFRNGGIKICPYNCMEWVLPVFDNVEDHICTLYAGYRAVPEKLPENVPLYGNYKGNHIYGNISLEKTREEEIFFVLEGLRQLGARLLQWYRENKNEKADHRNTRENMIHTYINRNFIEKIDIVPLAEKLHLSLSRTAHLVQELTGKSFQENIMEKRLLLACHILRYSDAPLKNVAEQSGFRDAAQFYRYFRKKMKVSPNDFRKEKS